MPGLYICFIYLIQFDKKNVSTYYVLGTYFCKALGITKNSKTNKVPNLKGDYNLAGKLDNEQLITNDMNVTKIREFRVFWADKVGEGPQTYSMVLGEHFLNVCWVGNLRKNSIQKMLNQDKNTVLNFSPKIKISKQNGDMTW